MPPKKRNRGVDEVEQAGAPLPGVSSFHCWDLMERVSPASSASKPTPGRHRIVLLSHDGAGERKGGEWTTFTQPPEGAHPKTAGKDVQLGLISDATLQASFRKVFHKYHVRPSSKHGLGMFATQQIDPAEVIVQEKSIWKFNMTLGEMLDLSQSQLHIIKKLSSCGSLQPFDTGRRKPLASLEEEKQEAELREVFDIYNTNHFQDAGMCPIMAHCNHSCEPNAVYMWDQDRQVEMLWAVRTIGVGEEILVGYHGDEFDTTRIRAETLRNEKGIEQCSCHCCTAPPKQREERDRKLQRLKELDEEVMPTLTDNPMKAIEIGEESLQLCLDVGNLYHTRRVANDVFQIVAGQDKLKVKLARHWAQRFFQYVKATKPPEKWSALEKMLPTYIRDPSRFRSAENTVKG